MCRYVPSQADTAVFEALSGAPKDAPHALRWYNHIKSFAAGMKQFPKAQKDAASYVSGGAAAAAKDDDDDVDLFGSDEEEDDEEKKRITEERLKAYHEKKSKKAAVIAKTSVLLDVKVASIITPDLLFKHIIARSLGTMRLTWTRCSRA